MNVIYVVKKICQIYADKIEELINEKEKKSKSHVIKRLQGFEKMVGMLLNPHPSCIISYQIYIRECCEICRISWNF